MKVRKQLSELRLEMGSRLGLRKPDEFAPLWSFIGLEICSCFRAASC